MSTWAREQQVCCTCRYWSGTRDIDFSASFFEAKESEGVCNGPHGSFRGCSMSECSSCSKWEQFRADY